jgi:ubiquinone/menaquinone biosynthesis C-methylase UbiE
MISPGSPGFIADLIDGRVLRPAGEHVYTVLPVDVPGQQYDRRAAAYDRVVGSRLYNRLLWDSSPAAYAAFAERAVRSAGGPLLDAGCGSLVFTADVYAPSDRPLVLVDLSLGMLHAARDRLVHAAGHVPDHVLLLHGDLRDLPFRPGCFRTVLCMGILHLFDDINGIVSTLANVMQAEGRMFMTSLIARRWIGERYLRLLHRAGEVAKPRTIDQLLRELRTTGLDFPDPDAIHVDGSMAFIAARRTVASGNGVR